MGNTTSDTNTQSPQLQNEWLNQQQAQNHPSGNQEEQKNKEELEINIMSSVQDITKLFLKEYIIVWHDPNVESDENQKNIKFLQDICEIKTFSSYSTASAFIKQAQFPCHVITSGTNGEAFIKDACQSPNFAAFYVFCGNVDYHKTWAQNYPKMVGVQNSIQALLAIMHETMMRWQRDSSALRVNFPAFAPMFDDTDKSLMNYMHLYLKGFVNFENRQQAKKDFLALAGAIFNDKQYLEEFQATYNDYNMKMILHWYTKECFLYKVTNNCLRIATSDSILYCRLVLKDLEAAIKGQYQLKSKYFNGLLYRGSYLSEEEWRKLQANRGRDIEMYGFLSTSKDRQVALHFARTDIVRKVLITIVVPDIVDKGEQGFAEVREFSSFAQEEEVLFNVRSRFTVLEADLDEIDEVKYRHLVLLYGSQSMKKYIREKSPVIQIKTGGVGNKCSHCPVNIPENDPFFIDLVNNENLVCMKCIDTGRTPLVLTSRAFLKNKEMLTVPGIASKPIAERIPMFGSRCVGCQRSKLIIAFKCVDCGNAKKLWCEKCISSETECGNQDHTIILERSAFSFWHEKMTDSEFNHLKYQEQIYSKSSTKGVFQQAEIFYESHDYKKAAQYYEDFIAQNSSKDHLDQLSTAYEHLGFVYSDLGEHLKALNAHNKCLEIQKTLHGDKSYLTASSYVNLGNVYRDLNDYEKALWNHKHAYEVIITNIGENHVLAANQLVNISNVYKDLGKTKEAIVFTMKALLIRKAQYGEDAPETAEVHNNLGVLYYDSGDYQKALEYHLKALNSRKNIFGDKHPETATSYNNYALVLQDLGRYSPALEAATKSMEIREAINGKEHLDTAISYNNIGSIYKALRDYQKGLEYYTKALEIRLKLGGENHPDVASSYCNLSGYYVDLGQFAKGIDYLMKSLKIFQALYGEKHSKVGAVYTNIGKLYVESGDLMKAFDFTSKAVDITKEVRGENHPETERSYFNFGCVLENCGTTKEAIEAYLKAEQIHKNIHEEPHKGLGDIYTNLGVCYNTLGDTQKALEYQLKALENRKKTAGEDSLEAASANFNCGVLYKSLKEYDKARSYYNISLAIETSKLPINYNKVGDIYSELGIMDIHSNQAKRGINSLMTAAEIWRKNLGENHSSTLRGYQNLGKIFKAIGLDAEGDEYLKKSLGNNN